MSLTGDRRADEGRGPDRRPAGRHERRVRRGGRAARARAHRARAGWCGRRCWPASSGCTPTRAPGGRSASEVPGLVGHPPRGDRAVRHVSAPPPPRCRWPAAPRGCGGRSRGAIGLRRRRPAVRARTSTGSRTATTLTAAIEAVFADGGGRALAAAAGRRGGPGGQGAHASTTSTPGTRRCPRACCSTCEHPVLGALQLPGLAAAVRRQRLLRRTARAPAASAVRGARRGDPELARRRGVTSRRANDPAQEQRTCGKVAPQLDARPPYQGTCVDVAVTLHLRRLGVHACPP